MAAWERGRTMVAQPQAIEGSSMDILSIERLTKVYGTGPAAVCGRFTASMRAG